MGGGGGRAVLGQCDNDFVKIIIISPLPPSPLETNVIGLTLYRLFWYSYNLVVSYPCSRLET